MCPVKSICPFFFWFPFRIAKIHTVCIRKPYPSAIADLLCCSLPLLLKGLAEKEIPQSCHKYKDKKHSCRIHDQRAQCSWIPTFLFLLSMYSKLFSFFFLVWKCCIFFMRPFWPIPTKSRGWSECIWLRYNLFLVGRLQKLCIFHLKLIALETQHQSYLFLCWVSMLPQLPIWQRSHYSKAAMGSSCRLWSRTTFSQPMKDQGRFPPLADTTGKLKAFGTCFCMECTHFSHALPFPGQGALGCCEHTPASTTASYRVYLTLEWGFQPLRAAAAGPRICTHRGGNCPRKAAKTPGGD